MKHNNWLYIRNKKKFIRKPANDTYSADYIMHNILLEYDTFVKSLLVSFCIVMARIIAGIKSER